MTATKVEEVKLSTLELAITCMLAETNSHPLQVRQMGQDSFMMTHNGVRALVFYHRMLDWGQRLEALESKELWKEVVNTEERTPRAYERGQGS